MALLTIPDRIRLLRARRYQGIYSRVAEQLGLTPSFVRRVALEQKRSKKVSDALQAELRRIERYLERVEKKINRAA